MVKKMWVSRRKIEAMESHIKKLEQKINAIERENYRKILEMSKRILKQPDEVLEEIEGMEKIEHLIEDFINS